MIKRFFSKGKCSLSYVLGAGKTDDPRHPTILAGNPDERIDYNWPALPIALAIPEIERLTGRTVIRPATIANIPDLTLKFHTPPTRAEALQAVETLLSINQLALIPLGDKFLKLVPMNTVRLEAPTYIQGSVLSLPPSGRIATKLFQLEFLRADEFAQSLQTVLHDQIRTFSFYQRANALLITDSITTLQRIETILKYVDRPAATPVQAKFYTLEFARASDIVTKLRTTLQAPALMQQLGASTTFNADDRTNQVFVIGDPRQFPFFDDLIKKLDIKSDPNTRNEVIRLRSADCMQVANILVSIIQGQLRAAQSMAAQSAAAQRPVGATGGFGAQGTTGRTGFGTPGGATGGTGIRGTTGGTGGTAPRGTTGGAATSTRGGTTGGGTAIRGQQSTTPSRGGTTTGGTGGAAGGFRGAQGATGATGGATGGFRGATAPGYASSGGGISGANLGMTDGDQFSAYITVQPDQRLNAIIISGTVDDIRIIKDLVEKIDILLSQVRIEVVIAEVTLTDEASTGIDSLGLQITGNKLTGFNASSPGIGIGGSPGSGGGVTGLASVARIASGYSLSGFIGLVTTPRKNNTAIVSNQSITTMHNRRANFFFGETRPVITASTMNDTSGSRSSSVTQMEIGTSIIVTPIIGYDGTVQLDLEQQISDVTGNVIVDGNTQYIIGKRNTNSTIIVKSGDIIVLGGIQKSSSLRTSSRLGPIPVIGDLLGKRTRSKVRNELIFFLRPVVLTNTESDNVPAYKQLDANMETIKDDVNKALGKELDVETAMKSTPQPPAAAAAKPTRKKR